ncbi:hypothetical protein [Sulfurimonas sp.]
METAAQIDQTISAIPESGHRGVDAVDDFVLKQEAYQDHQRDTLQPELSTFRTQANTLSTDVTNKATIATDKAAEAKADADSAALNASIALGASNYLGDWVADYEVVGYPKGVSVSVAGLLYMSKIDNNLAEPVYKTENASWYYRDIQTATPIIVNVDGSPVTTNIDENATRTYKIANNDPEKTYKFSALKGSIDESTYDPIDGTFEFKAHDILDGNSSTDSFSVTASIIGEIKSESSNTNLIVNFIAITDDVAITDNLTVHSYNDGFDAVTGGIKSNKDNAVRISPTVEQGEAETDWVEVSPVLDLNLPELDVHADSNDTLFKTKSFIDTGYKVKFNGTGNDRVLETVSSSPLTFNPSPAPAFYDASETVTDGGNLSFGFGAFNNDFTIAGFFTFEDEDYTTLWFGDSDSYIKVACDSIDYSFGHYDGTIDSRVDNATPRITNEEFFMCARVSGNEMLLQINDSKATLTKTVSFSAGTNTLIGRDGVNGSQNMNGATRALRVFARALSDAEIEEFRLEGSPLYSATVTSVGATITQAHLDVDVNLSIGLEPTTGECLMLPDVNLTVEAGTQTSMDITEEVVVGSRLYVVSDDGTEYNEMVSSVTGTSPYVVDITNFGLGAGEIAVKAYRKGVEPLTITSATNVQVVARSLKSGLVVSGGKVEINGKEVASTTVVESTVNVDVDISSSTDPFEDNSLGFKLEFTDNLKATKGIDATAIGTPAYSTSTHGKGMHTGSALINGNITKVNDFTISVKTKLDSTTSQRQPWNLLRDQVNYGLKINDGAGNVGIYHTGTGLSYLTIGGQTFDTNDHTWTYVKSSTTGSHLYKDGVLLITDALQTGDITAGAGTGNDTVNGYNGGTTNAVTTGGYNDIFEYYTRGLDASEVAKLHTQMMATDLSQYEINIADFGTAPTTCGIASKSKRMTLSSETFLDGVFTRTYNAYAKAGSRAIASMIEIAKDVIALSPLVLNLKKEG